MKGIQLFGRIFFLVLILNHVSAQSYLQFVENKGQWDKQVAFKGDLNTGAFFLKPDGGYKMVLHNHADLKAILQQKHGETSASNTNTSTVLHSHAYEVKFINANPQPQVIKEKQLEGYNNYFIGNDSTKWAGGCKIYQAITYKNVYPNVDVRYYTSSTGNLKYDLIVYPGGDVNAIAMYFDGVDGLKVKDGTLRIKTSVDEVQEGVPFSYLSRPAGKQETPCNYEVKGNIVRFVLKEQVPANTTLVIDPNLIFSTFTGSKSDNWGYTATYDDAGCLYAGGIVFGSGFPLSNGAFQSYQGGINYNGNGNGSGFDMGIIKFGPNGDKMIYATYIGGSKGNEQPHSLVVDNAGNLVIGGRSNSSDYPQKTNETNINGSGWDIVITKLNPTATALIGSMRIGGAKDDGVNIADKESPVNNGQLQYSLRRNYGDDARSEVIVDAVGNVYMAGCSQSIDFPLRNAFQNANAGGEFGQDAVVIKTDNTLSKIIFSSYLGGTADDAAFVLALSPLTNNIYVAGGTASTDFPGDKTGVIGTANQGGVCDGFVSVISNTASPQIIRSSYFGTGGTDLIYGIQFDKLGFPYIMGTTTGSWAVTSNVAFKQTGGKQFISKLQPDLSAYIYSTIFGTQALTPNISPTAFLVDRCENVYVSGWGGGATFTKYPSAGTAGLTTTGSPYKATSQGNDFYFIAIAKNAASQLYGDFFGQDPPQGWANHVDGGTSRFDRRGVIYQALCANCFGDGGRGSGNFPVYPPGGAYASVNGTTQASGVVSGCNLAAIKIAFNLAGVMAGIQPSINGVIRDTSGCMPLNVTFTDTVGIAQSYIWNFGDGTATSTSTSPTTSHTFTTAGIYKVMEIAVDLNTCNQYDTSYVTIRVRNDQAVLNLSAVKVPPCTSLAYQFTNSSIAPANKPFTSTSFLLNFGDGTTQVIGLGTVTHSYTAPGIYNAKLTLLDTNYCNYTDSFPLQLHIAANVKAQFTTPTAGCVPYTAAFNNTTIGSGAATYIWDFGDGSTSTQTNPSHVYTSVGSYNIRLIANDTGTCNKTDTSAYFTITVYTKPVADFSASPQPPKNNTAITFTNLSTNAVSYQWLFGDGDTLNTTSMAAVSHLYNATQSYNACLKAFSAGGCVDSVCRTITALISPVFDVPTAFSPNGDGVNDKIYIRGFGISSIQWNIYNRWGALVYQSFDKSQGWDGTYKGVLQPQDVFHYVLEVVMSDGKKYFKKGDITLLR
jgi:gliding motility-associated-like protein